VRATLVALALLAASASARAQPALPPDSASAVRSAFDVITRENYLRRHAFSLDHFLEFEPGGVMARLGPIGNDAFYSRRGIGRGRAALWVNGIPLNDPQDGSPPLAHVATSGLSALALDPGSGPGAGLEGMLVLRELVAPRARPHTFIELSKGTNEVRQRRVRFGSEAGRVGLDLSYDEVLDDGYDFDANEAIPPSLGAPPEGRALSRNAAIVLRGDLEDDARYSVGLRRFRSSTTGDLVSAQSEATRGGHLAWATVGLHGGEASVYGRGYTSERPDSETTNESVGGVAAWSARRGGSVLRVFALGEHTNASQRVGAGEARQRVDYGNAGVTAEAGAARLTWFVHGDVAGDRKSSAWGAGGGLRAGVARGDVTLSARRSYRLPSIGERYLPQHARDAYVLLGNVALEGESALEAGADWTLRAGPVTNRVRASWMRSAGYITFAPAPGDSSFVRRATNSGEESAMSFFEERLVLSAALGALEVRADAGALYSTGDREDAFRSVPRAQVNASLVVGREFFEKSSALYLEGSYQFMDERRDYDGAALSSYHVVNLGLVGRLIDARVYLKWLNVLDEKYQTVSGYLMTPRTIAYGIEWTLFD
jgi:hypothetical protein